MFGSTAMASIRDVSEASRASLHEKLAGMTAALSMPPSPPETGFAGNPPEAPAAEPKKSPKAPWGAPQEALKNVHPSQLYEPPGTESQGMKKLKGLTKWYLAGAHPVAVMAARATMGDFAPNVAERRSAYQAGRGGWSGYGQPRKKKGLGGGGGMGGGAGAVQHHYKADVMVLGDANIGNLGGRSSTFHGSATTHQQG
jgi:hypothetical protein